MVALAPADPVVLGVPAGIWLELLVVVVSTLSLAFLCGRLLPRADGRERP